MEQIYLIYPIKMIVGKIRKIRLNGQKEGFETSPYLTAAREIRIKGQKATSQFSHFLGRTWHAEEPRAERDGQHADGGARLQPAAHRGAARLHRLLHAQEHLRGPGALSIDSRTGLDRLSFN